MRELAEFEKKKEFLICVDSDGCAMDTMELKHRKCFGPCLIREWNLEPWAGLLLQRWNSINLYTSTRGINRFKALALLLQEVNSRYTPVEGLSELVRWTSDTAELSNRALETAVRTAAGPCLARALAWSRAVNTAIQALPPESSQPFDGVKAALAAAYAAADVAVVSSANREAVESEWARCGLADTVSTVCCQELGSKTRCISALLEKGYRPDNVLMVGDAPGDLEAARQNGVFFYPILTRREAESWKFFCREGLPALLSGRYARLEKDMEHRFADNLSAGCRTGGQCSAPGAPRVP